MQNDMTPIPGYPGYYLTREGDVFSERGSKGRELRNLKPVHMGCTGHKLSPAVKLMRDGAPFSKTIRQLLRITFGESE